MSLHFALSILDAILEIFSLTLYLYLFSFRRKKQIPLPITILSFIAAETCLVLLSEISLPFPSFLQILFRLFCRISVIFLLSLLFDSSMSDRIFLAVSFHGLFALSEFITSAVFRLTINALSKPSADLMNLVPINIYPVLLLFISILLFLRKRFIKGISFPYIILLLLTPVVTVASVFNLSINDSYFLYPKSYLIFILCLLIINCSTYVLLDFSLKAALEKEYYQHIQQQNQYQQEKYEQLSLTYRKIQGYQHDTKKQLMFIKDCINENKIEAILPYMEESLDNLEKSYGRIHTGNLVIDSFLSHYSLLAEKNQIVFTTDLSVNPSLIPVKDYDLSIILGNLLENSINASQKSTDTNNRKIDVYIYTDENAGQLIIHITNTTAVTAASEPINELIHGYGLANVEECVKKYCGIFRTRQTETEYEATAIIPLLPPQLT